MDENKKEETFKRVGAILKEEPEGISPKEKALRANWIIKKGKNLTFAKTKTAINIAGRPRGSQTEKPRV